MGKNYILGIKAGIVAGGIFGVVNVILSYLLEFLEPEIPGVTTIITIGPVTLIYAFISGAIGGIIFGIIFAYAYFSLPGSTSIKKALVLTMMFFIARLVIVVLFPPKYIIMDVDLTNIAITQVILGSFIGLFIYGLSLGYFWKRFKSGQKASPPS